MRLGGYSVVTCIDCESLLTIGRRLVWRRSEFSVVQPLVVSGDSQLVGGLGGIGMIFAT